MNLLLLDQPDLISPDRALISGRRVDHLVKTNQCQQGKILCTGLLNGPIGTGQILEFSGDKIQLEIQLNENPPAPAPVQLVLALPRPKYLGRIIQSVTTLGVKSIHLINSFRVEKSFGKVSN